MSMLLQLSNSEINQAMSFMTARSLTPLKFLSQLQTNQEFQIQVIQHMSKRFPNWMGSASLYLTLLDAQLKQSLMSEQNEKLKTNIGELTSYNDELKTNNDELKTNNDELKLNNNELKLNVNELTTQNDMLAYKELLLVEQVKLEQQIQNIRVDIERIQRVETYKDILTSAALACIELGIYWAPDSEGNYSYSASKAGRLLKRTYAPIYKVVVEDSANKVNPVCRNLYRVNDTRLTDAIVNLFLDRPELFVSWSDIEASEQTSIIREDNNTFRYTLNLLQSRYTELNSKMLDTRKKLLVVKDEIASL